MEQEIGYADEKSISPAQRARVERLRWLYEFIDSQRDDGISPDGIKLEMMARYGMAARTVDEYIRTLAARGLILSHDRRWYTLRNVYWDDLFRSLLKNSSTENSDENQIEQIIMGKQQATKSTHSNGIPTHSAKRKPRADRFRK